MNSFYLEKGQMIWCILKSGQKIPITECNLMGQVVVVVVSFGLSSISSEDVDQSRSSSSHQSFNHPVRGFYFIISLSRKLRVSLSGNSVTYFLCFGFFGLNDSINYSSANIILYNQQRPRTYQIEIIIININLTAKRTEKQLFHYHAPFHILTRKHHPATFWSTNS